MIQRLFLSVLCVFQIGCATNVSKIVVSRGPSHGTAQLATTRAVCAQVARHYGLVARPMRGESPDVTWYQLPSGTFLVGSGPPAIVIAPAPAPNVAVITVGGTVTTDARRREVTSDLLARLQSQLGRRYVRSFEDTWTDF